MRKTVYINILLLTITVITFFFALEIVFRLTYKPEPNIIPIPTNIKETEIIYQKADVCIKKDEVRGIKQTCLDIPDLYRFFKRFKIEKPKNTFRIICLGDSFTQGVGVETFEQSYPHQLKEMLNENSKNLTYEVYPIGFGGFNTYQELVLLEEVGLQYNPDLIILQYYPNDLLYTMHLTEIGNHTVLLPPNKEFVFINQELIPVILPFSIETNKLILSHSYFVRFLNKKLDSLYQKFKKPRLDEKEWAELNFDSLKKIIEITKKEDIPLILLFVSGAIKERCEIDAYPKLEVKGIALQNNIPFIDLCDYTKGRSDLESKLISKGPEDHYNEKGYRIMAEALFENIKNLGFV